MIFRNRIALLATIGLFSSCLEISTPNTPTQQTTDEQQSPEAECQECIDSQPPIARFEYTVLDKSTGRVELDASASSDPEGTALQYSWDLDSDGEFEINYSDAAKLFHKFSENEATITLKVVDLDGAIGTQQETIVIRTNIDQSPAPSVDPNDGDNPDTPTKYAGHIVSNSIPFAITFEVTEIVHDPVRDYLYISDKNAGRLYIVDAQSGNTLRYFNFDYMPESLYLSPDGNELYVALLTQNHSSYWWEEDQNGFISVIDLENTVVDRTFEITTDPFDILVTTDDTLIVSSGSGQHTEIHLYSILGGFIAKSGGIREQTIIRLHPSEDFIIGADRGVSPNDVERFDISPTSISRLGDSPYHGDYQFNSNVWFIDNGDSFVARSGNQFVSPTMVYEKQFWSGTGYIEQLSIDASNTAGIHLVDDGPIHIFNTNSHLLFGAPITSNKSILWAQITSDAVLLVENNGSGDKTLVRAAHPCGNCALNTAPVANLNAPSSGNSTTSEVLLDASGSSDDGAQLRYRWDFDGDGNWDTEFGPNPTTSHHFQIPGTYPVQVQVVDEYGAGHIASFSTTVDFVDSPPTAQSGGIPYTLGFEFDGAVSDPAQGLIYAFDTAAKRVYIVNPTNGLSEFFYEFPHEVQALTISSSLSKLFVALRTEPINNSTPYNKQLGYVATIDLITNRYVGIFATDVNPFDIKLTPANNILVSSSTSSYGYGLIRLYDINGAALDSVSTGRQSALFLHPVSSFLFSVENYYSSADEVDKYSIIGAQITHIESSPYSNYSLGNKVWFVSNGQQYLTQTGRIFDTDTYEFVRNAEGWPGYLATLARDFYNNIGVALSGNGGIVTYQLDSMLPISTASASDDILWGTVIGASLYTVEKGYSSPTRLIQRPHPCPTCSANEAPVADLYVQTISPATNAHLVFDASNSTDDASTNNLEYRWDFDGDQRWDTEFGSSATMPHRYYISGTQSAIVQVKDAFGKASTAHVSVVVAPGIDYGKPISHPINMLPFYLDIYAVNSTANVTYIGDRAGKQLYLFDNSASHTTRVFDLPYYPTDIELSTDFQTIYVAMGAEVDGEEVGYIAVFDANDNTWVRTFETTGKVTSLVATATRIIYSSYENYDNYLIVLDAATGIEIESNSLSFHQELQISGDGSTVLAIDSSFMHHYTLTSSGLLYNRQSSFDSYYTQYRMYDKAWFIDDGSTILTDGGDLIDGTDFSFIRSLTPSGFSAFSFASNPTQDYIDLLQANIGSRVLARYQLSTGALLKSVQANSSALSMWHDADTFHIFIADYGYPVTQLAYP